MRLLYIGKYQFTKKDGKSYALPAYGNAFWQKYLDVFDGVDVLGEGIKGYLNNGTLTELTDERVTVSILPPNTSPLEFKNDTEVKKLLKERISGAQAVLIKPACRKGIMAITICKELHKPYMVELTGDLLLTLSIHPNILRRWYGPLLHRQILKAIKDCQYGLYVTETYLQKVYPIAGEQCGCTDTAIPDPDRIALDKRISKIQAGTDKPIIGLVASYHDARKGIDTAIEALERMNNKQAELHVLGLGTEEDRNKWYEYAQKHNVRERLYFDPSLSGVNKVLEWNDNIDVHILPSRSEGLPRCVVEALSRACPCILSDVCGLPELVDSKWLHKPGDSQKLAILIDKMLADKGLQIEAAKKNFDHSYDYTQDVLRERRNAFLMRFKAFAERY